MAMPGPSLEVWVRVLNLRHLPLALTNKGPFTVQASLGGSGSVTQEEDRRQTAGSIWGKGIKNRVSLALDIMTSSLLGPWCCHQ